MSKLEENRKNLIAILQGAYSGELAAAYAYRGHWHSVSAPDQRESIRTIEEDEWRHRKLVGEMLAALASTPHKGRETRASLTQTNWRSRSGIPLTSTSGMELLRWSSAMS